MPMEQSEWIERYRGARAWLDELIAFVEAIGPEVASTVRAQDDYDSWIGQLRAYQWVCCERCGAVLAEDVLGAEAFSIGDFQRVCGVCHDELSGPCPNSMRRLARLTVYAAEHPDLLVGLLVEAQRRHRLDDRALEWRLGLHASGVLRLALCQRPRVGSEDGDLAAIAAAVGCPSEELRRLFAEAPEGEPAMATATRRNADGEPDADKVEVLPF
jgi:hypothetical protein